MLTELSVIPEASKEVLKLLPLVAEISQEQHIVFLETVCKQLPLLAKHLGVRSFKNYYFEAFVDPIFKSLVRFCLQFGL